MTLVEALRHSPPKLSLAAKITLPQDSSFADVTARWSDYNAPQPGLAVTIASESDIEQIVQWTVSHKLRFLAQSGGHGSMAHAKIGPSDVLIDLRGMNKTMINIDEETAIIEAGALTGDVIAEAHNAKRHIVIGNCNSTGVMGPALGGGMSRMLGHYGIAIDNMISARVVTANGKAITVSDTENIDLWWAIRGAGHSFGIVSSIKVKAHPQINGGQHWQYLLAFTPDKLEAVTEAINDLDFKAGMSIHYMFACFPPDFNPGIGLSLWSTLNDPEARTAFAPLFSLSPIFTKGGIIPYGAINADADIFGAKGGRKRLWGVGLKRLEPKAMREGWELYTQFVASYPEAKMTFTAVECYSWDKAREVADDETAFPWRGINFWIICNTIHQDPALDQVAQEFGEGYRAVMRKHSEAPDGPYPLYVNFASGDEKPEEMYGDEKRLVRLRALKAKWDPEGYFNCYNPFV